MHRAIIHSSISAEIPRAGRVRGYTKVTRERRAAFGSRPGESSRTSAISSQSSVRSHTWPRKRTRTRLTRPSLWSSAPASGCESPRQRVRECWMLLAAMPLEAVAAAHLQHARTHDAASLERCTGARNARGVGHAVCGSAAHGSKRSSLLAVGAVSAIVARNCSASVSKACLQARHQHARACERHAREVAPNGAVVGVVLSAGGAAGLSAGRPPLCEPALVHRVGKDMSVSRKRWSPGGLIGASASARGLGELDKVLPRRGRVGGESLDELLARDVREHLTAARTPCAAISVVH